MVVCARRNLPREGEGGEDSMTQTHRHVHPCAHCRTPMDCYSEQERNEDGFPEVICPSYHLSGGVLAVVLCEACEREDIETARPWAV